MDPKSWTPGKEINWYPRRGSEDGKVPNPYSGVQSANSAGVEMLSDEKNVTHLSFG
jgi:hypothetical protein